MAHPFRFLFGEFFHHAWSGIGVLGINGGVRVQNLDYRPDDLIFKSYVYGLIQAFHYQANQTSLVLLLGNGRKFFGVVQSF